MLLLPDRKLDQDGILCMHSRLGLRNEVLLQWGVKPLNTYDVLFFILGCPACPMAGRYSFSFPFFLSPRGFCSWNQLQQLIYYLDLLLICLKKWHCKPGFPELRMVFDPKLRKRKLLVGDTCCKRSLLPDTLQKMNTSNSRATFCCSLRSHHLVQLHCKFKRAVSAPKCQISSETPGADGTHSASEFGPLLPAQPLWIRLLWPWLESQASPKNDTVF